jgi:hypothetical protein
MEEMKPNQPVSVPSLRPNNNVSLPNEQQSQTEIYATSLPKKQDLPFSSSFGRILSIFQL